MLKSMMHRMKSKAHYMKAMSCNRYTAFLPSAVVAILFSKGKHILTKTNNNKSDETPPTLLTWPLEVKIGV